ncbi:MAG: hypothetical protein CM15mP74_07990 [Halieaceae bacterium]|nr:MAG: hypothetical protein CM15mP74_07990 [Halieaceae bacterium]
MLSVQCAQRVLPDIVPSSGDLGKTAGVPGLPDGIPITGERATNSQHCLVRQALIEVPQNAPLVRARSS